MDLLRPPQGQEVSDSTHVGQAEGGMAVVHGDNPFGRQGLADLLRPGGVHGIGAAHGNHHQVHRAHGRNLLHRELVPQVPQVGRRHSGGGKDPDGVLPPQCAALGVVKRGDLPDGERTLPGRQHPHRLHGVVVKVLVAAKHLMRGGLQGRVTLHTGVGVQQNGISVLLQQKAGVSQPGELHDKSSL